MSYRARQKNGNQKRHDKRACAICHARVGFGLKASAFMLGTSIGLPRKARLSVGMSPRVAASGKSAYKPAMGYKKAEPCPVKAQADAFRAEQSKLKRLDAHWFGSYYFGHIECARWIGNTIAKRQYQKRKSNPVFKVAMSTRHRIWTWIKSRGGKADSSSLVGCSWKTLAKHIESQFTNEMNWENYGTHWHIDHIRPCASFDLSDPEQVKGCFHHSNLQPLKVMDNRMKSSRWRGVTHRPSRGRKALLKIDTNVQTT